VPKRIAVTMGDPAGVGPEICLKLLRRSEEELGCQLLLFGDQSVLERVSKRCQLPPPEQAVPGKNWLQTLPGEGHVVVDFGFVDGGKVCPGRVQAACGEAAFRYVEEGIRAAMEGSVDAVSTAPINKEAWSLAGISFPGHTEAFTTYTGASESCMMLYSAGLACSFVTTHIPLREVSSQITRERLLRVMEWSRDAVRRLNGKDPRLLVCGLNPHAGEGGLFGEEERKVIAPSVEEAKARGMSVEGPLSPDACFIAKHREATDCFVCMYHDQGHIPFKMLAFETGVNITLGLSVVRTSVDHGTAFDIAWSGQADPSSLLAAVDCALRLTEAT